MNKEDYNRRKEEAITQYIENGWRVLPADGKRPVLNDWTNRASANKEEVEKFNWSSDRNVAIACGKKSNLVVLDFDKKSDEPLSIEQAKELLEKVGGSLPDTYTVKTGGGGFHFYFTYPEKEMRSRTGLLKKELEGKHSLDIRGEGGCVIAPPSIHPETKKKYELVRDIEVASLPSSWVELLFTYRRPGQSFEKLSDEDDVIIEGERNDTLFKYACSLRDNQMEPVAILQELRELNYQRCRPCLDDSEVQTIAHSASKYSVSERASDKIADNPMSCDECMEYLDQRVIRIIVNDKPCVFNYLNEHLYKLGDAKQIYSNVKIKNPGGKNLPGFGYWWNRARQYNGFCIEYKKLTSEGDRFNRFTGFPVVPNKNGKYEILKKHVLENVCDGDEAKNRFFWDFFAQMIQEPDRVRGIVLVLIGENGVGKSIIGDIFNTILGQYYQQVDDFEQVVGDYNSIIENKLLMMLDEVNQKTSRQKIGRFRSLATSRTARIRKMYTDTYYVDNKTRFILTTNDESSLVLPRYDRRHFVLHVSSRQRNNKDFFKSLLVQLEEEDGYGRLLYDLQTRDISGWDWTNIPQSELRVQNVVDNFDVIDQWLYESLDEPGEAVFENGLLYRRKDVNGFKLSSQELMNQLRAYCEYYKINFIPSKTALGTRLGKFYELRKTINKVQLYIFPNLETMRAIFTEKQGVSFDSQDKEAAGQTIGGGETL